MTAKRVLPLVLLLALLAPSAAAHAVLASADPPVNGRAEEGIQVITFRFTEDVEREYTTADLVDLQGVSRAAGPVEFDPDERNVIRLPVEPLESGIYSASWRALSVDTHTTRGSFVFAVGNATLRPGQYSASASDPAGQDLGEVARDGFARFAFYIGLFLAAGMPLFALVVLRDAQPPRGLHGTAAAFGLVGAAGAFVVLLFLGVRTGLGLDAIATAPGRSLAWRGGLTFAAATASLVAFAKPDLWRPASWVAVGLGAAATLATALGSHAAAVKDWTTLLIAADAVHLAMGAIWVGGVVGFLHIGPGRSALDVSRIVHRFSPLAIASVLLLIGTGTLASLAHMPCATDYSDGIPCLKALRTETYVRLVALKVLLMVPLVLLGAYNKYRVGPRLAQGTWSPGFFRRVVQVEAVTMALVLGAAGMLAASAPPESDVETGDATLPYLELDNTTAKSHVIVQVSPNPVTVGLQELVIIVHPLGPTLPNSTQVQVKIWPEGEREPDVTIELEKVTPNEWEKEDGFFTSEGTWNLLVLLQRPDEGFVKIPFEIPVVNPS